MGLALCLRRVDAAKLQRLIVTPSEVHHFLLGTNPARSKAITFISRIMRARELAAGAGGTTAGLGQHQAEEIDLDKAWHISHFVLTGSAAKCAGPEGSLLADERVVGTHEVGAGRPWALLPDETKRFAEAIASFGFEDMKARFDIEAMQQQKVYLADGMQRETWCFEYVWENIEKLQNFLAAAVKNGQGLILYMT